MDKLETETWEEYVFRKDLFTISYQDNNKEIIKGIQIPDELDFIMDELYKIRNKYKMRSYDVYDDEIHTQEDIVYWKWLMAKKRTLKTEIDEKNQSVYIKNYNRYKELINIISENHKEQLEELFELKRKIPDDYGVPIPPYPSSEYNEYCKNKLKYEKNYSDLFKEKNNKNIESYKKYMKNKEILLQINELEKNLNELKSKII